MEKLIIIPEGQLTTVLESYDNLIEEFAKGRWQFIELKRMSKQFTLLDYQEELDDTALKKLFNQCCENLVNTDAGEKGEYPDEVMKLLIWIRQNETDELLDFQNNLIGVLSNYEFQWFVNGFRYAMQIFQTRTFATPHNTI